MSLLSAGSTIANAAIGMIGQRKREKRAMNNQKQLMDIQHKNQRELNQQGFDLQKRMWDETNYGAQMEHLKNAGLNPAIMYGMSGGGGVTTGSQGGGSAAGGHAPAPQEMPTFDIQQSLMMKAQLDLMKAQADKTEAEADNIRGEEGTIGASQIQKLIAETSNEEQKNKLLKLDESMKKLDNLWHSERLYNEVNKLAMEMDLLQGETWIQENSKQAIVDEINARAIGQGILNELNMSRIRLTDAQENQIKEAVMQKWKEIDLHDTEVNIKIAQTIINGITGIGGLVQAGRLAEAMKKSKELTTKTTETIWTKRVGKGGSSGHTKTTTTQ